MYQPRAPYHGSPQGVGVRVGSRPPPIPWIIEKKVFSVRGPFSHWGPFSSRRVPLFSLWGTSLHVGDFFLLMGVGAFLGLTLPTLTKISTGAHVPHT